LLSPTQHCHSGLAQNLQTFLSCLHTRLHTEETHHILLHRNSGTTQSYKKHHLCFHPSSKTLFACCIRELYSNSTLFQHPSCTTTPQYTMTIDMDWSPAFCLACDRQTDGNVYCSEACRLAEYDASSNAGSTAASPTSPRGPISLPAKQSSNGFFMEPAYNFSRAKPYGTTPSRPTHLYQSASRPQSSPVAYSTKPVLTPSSSQSSLFSMQSTHSASSDQNQVSDESRRALRAYASSFDQSRYSRRQSTH
jgi:hypothetical protein